MNQNILSFSFVSLIFISACDRTSLSLASSSSNSTDPPPILFLSRTQTPADMSNNPNSLTGPAGADALFNADAQTYGTAAVKERAHYKALLITSSSIPCSEVSSVNGCSGSYASPSWPLKPEVTYLNPDGVTPFNTVTATAIFPGTSPQGLTHPDLTYPDGTTPPASTPFWFGAQSIFLSGAGNPTEVTGWVYADLANSPQYVTNFAICNQWTSQAGFHFGAHGQTANTCHCAQNPCGTSNMWQNYYSDDQGGFESDTLSVSNYNSCDTSQNVFCISSP